MTLYIVIALVYGIIALAVAVLTYALICMGEAFSGKPWTAWQKVGCSLVWGVGWPVTVPLSLLAFYGKLG